MEERIGQIQTILKERLNAYRDHIAQLELQLIDVEGHLWTCGCGKFKIMPFLCNTIDNS